MKKTISIIGGGPAGLMLAALLDPKLFDITIFEKNKSVGRKFLVAGKGGFNLTHSEPLAQFHKRYTPSNFLLPALNYFDNQQLRTWLSELKIPTFIGSSKRVFPEKGIKPIEVLKAITNHLENKDVQFKLQQEWTGWNVANDLVFKNGKVVQTDLAVFALGGASWKVTGSDGNWLEKFQNKGVKTQPFQSANCAFKINWSEKFLNAYSGKPLKNISISSGKKTQKGEAVITEFGLEGNAIYALSPEIQKQLREDGEAIVSMDLKPGLSKEDILKKFQQQKGSNIAEQLRKQIKLSPPQLALLKSQISKSAYLNQTILIEKIKTLPLSIIAAAPLDEAISTSGGIDLAAINHQYELNTLKNTYCIGEMLDWNAPTGGYLLQACFSMGAYLAMELNKANATVV